MTQIAKRIPKMDLFYSPEDQDELYRMVQQFNGDEAVVAAVVHGWTWNFLADHFNAVIDEIEAGDYLKETVK